MVVERWHDSWKEIHHRVRRERRGENRSDVVGTGQVDHSLDFNLRDVGSELGDVRSKPAPLRTERVRHPTAVLVSR
jgi:hypothetical protein